MLHIYQFLKVAIAQDERKEVKRRKRKEMETGIVEFWFSVLKTLKAASIESN